MNRPTLFDNPGKFVWDGPDSTSGYFIWSLETSWQGKVFPKIGICDIYRASNGEPRVRMVGLSDTQKAKARGDLNGVKINPRSYIRMDAIPQLVAAIADIYAHLTGSSISEDLGNCQMPPNVVLRPLSPSDTQVPPNRVSPDTPSTSNIDQLIQAGSQPELDPMIQAYIKESLPDD